jgi:hypothetical protein
VSHPLAIILAYWVAVQIVGGLAWGAFCFAGSGEAPDA